MTKKLKKVHEPVAERDPEDKPKFVEVHDRNPLFDAVAAWRWLPSAR